MIGISKLLCGMVTPGDTLRYNRETDKLPANMLQFAMDKRPVVVWTSTRRCNLHCLHCYADSENREYPDEMSTVEARRFIDDLAEFRVPVLLFSGGEPFIRPDLLELGVYAKDKGIRTVISTNGTLITPDKARQVKEAGFSYVGVSLDGIGEHNDKFRGHKGAYQAAVEGIRNCLAVNQKVGLRFTITQHNYLDVPAVLDLIEKEGVPRACFYHLVYSGRGEGISKDDLPHDDTRRVIDQVIDRVRDWYARGIEKDILTVDNHADAIYLYLRLLKEDPKRAADALTLLQFNGGNNTGIAIANVDNLGYVHPDQFTTHHTFGNVRRRKFGEIWTDLSQPILKGLKDRRGLLKGRCSECKWLELCNGNFRARAEAATGDFWESDPACYLTDREIGLGRGAAAAGADADD
ncbi:MAG TPA: radical SAM protein [Bacillota bacterium]|jgi:putative heme d1 biosynthesis radical SAM protein NirJ1